MLCSVCRLSSSFLLDNIYATEILHNTIVINGIIIAPFPQIYSTKRSNVYKASTKNKFHKHNKKKLQILQVHKNVGIKCEYYVAINQSVLIDTQK